ncbi:MAG: aspartate--tRNA ligase, partial [Firmicutes bacterium]|nr:aspartate--tRNA ligase [Bacillota bacterium]
MKRTHNNGELNVTNIGETVVLKGWVAKKRDLGGLVFIDLRDIKGLTQLAFNPTSSLYEKTLEIKNEYVLEIKGKVIERSSKNKNIPTGEIEVEVEELVILNTAKQPPIMIQDDTDALEETRLKYRYLDLRRPILQNNFLVRHQTVQAVRDFLNKEDFIDFETPILTKSTPEGARDYLVPSRVNLGTFYALPQSPQIFKQLLMISGFERYYQIVKCFRDEDLRADRQPEFTQVDLEMSFISEEDVMDLTERMFKSIWQELNRGELKTPFRRLDYKEAILKYGSDKPDLRFDLEIIEVTEIVRQS